MEKILILLRNHTGNDFSFYKKATLYRRIERRMSLHQISTMQNYARFLRTSPQELNLLFKELLIGVTNFFRDPEVWEKIKLEIFPHLFSTHPQGTEFRAWVPACSTGEEAYSLAIVFMEALTQVKLQSQYRLQIFATDLDEDAIKRARAGIFHNPPFTNLNIISCRNLLIYLDPASQQKLIPLFHYALTCNGILLLGSSETIGGSPLFSELDKKAQLYQRLDKPSPIVEPAR